MPIGVSRLNIALGGVLTLLTDFLPNWIPAEMWIVKRLVSNSGFLAVSKLGFKPQDARLRSHMNQRELPYITHTLGPGLPSPQIPADMALEYCQKHETQVTAHHWAQLFGVDIATVVHWDTVFPDWRVCNFHPHTNFATYTTCAVKILERYVAASAHKWLKNCLDKCALVLDEPAMMRQHGIDEPQLLCDFVQAHNVAELRAPDDTRRYLYVL